MSFDFLTLEDVNTIIRTYGKPNFWYEFDSSKIPIFGVFDEILYDFFKVTKEASSDSDYVYEFTLEPVNSIFIPCWGRSENIGNISYNQSTNKFTILTTDEDFNIVFYMGYHDSELTPGGMLFHLRDEEISLDYESLNGVVSVGEVSWGGGMDQTVNVYVDKGYNYIATAGHYPVGYLFVNLVKSDFVFDCTQELYLGTVNHVALGTDAKYKPGGAMIGDYTPRILVEYNGKVIKASYDDDVDDYCFDLDLSVETVPHNVKFRVLVERNEVINHTVTDVSLPCDFAVVSSDEDFVSVFDVGSAVNVLKLGADIELDANVLVEHDIKIDGSDHTINLNDHSFILDEGVEFIGENIILDYGNKTFIQKNHTKLRLENCKFYNHGPDLGSCIRCDIDSENITEPNDFETVLINCFFKNNYYYPTLIFHGGNLTIENCKFLLDDYGRPQALLSPNYPAFLYQTDGNATITNSVFDITLSSGWECQWNQNLGLGLSLIMCGENATINGATHSDLQKDDSLPFFEYPYRNRSHLYATYYYHIHNIGCVSISPKIGLEDKNCCHSVSGLDWLFKNNTQIRRGQDSGNNERIIIWDDD